MSVFIVESIADKMFQLVTSMSLLWASLSSASNLLTSGTAAVVESWQPTQNGNWFLLKARPLQSYRKATRNAYRQPQPQPVDQPYVLTISEVADASSEFSPNRHSPIPPEAATGSVNPGNISKPSRQELLKLQKKISSNVDDTAIGDSLKLVRNTEATTPTTLTPMESTSMINGTAINKILVKQSDKGVKYDHLLMSVDATLARIRQFCDFLSNVIISTDGSDRVSPRIEAWLDEVQGRNDDASKINPSLAAITTIGSARKSKKIKKKKKLAKLLLPLLIAYKLKFFMLIPIMIGGLTLLVGSTGLAGFFFALFTVVAASRDW